jgi:hypothetical protein
VCSPPCHNQGEPPGEAGRVHDAADRLVVVQGPFAFWCAVPLGVGALILSRIEFLNILARGQIDFFDDCDLGIVGNDETRHSADGGMRFRSE